MKLSITHCFAAAAFLSVIPARVSSLMLDFGNPATNAAVAAPYLTVSPAHQVGSIPASETTWNIITTSADRNDLSWSNNTSAGSGVVLNLGQEATAGSGLLSFTTTITNLTLAGTGGATPGQQSLLTAGSVYGADTNSTSAARDGFFGGGTAGATGAAIGLRLDGLAAGSYQIYVTARNTNTNQGLRPMNLYSATGTLSESFDFSALSATSQQNPAYSTSVYNSQYSSFVNGDSYVRLDVTLGAGQSLYLASDGADLVNERRGFLNSIQIVSVPEPGAATLCVGLMLFPVLRRNRRFY